MDASPPDASRDDGAPPAGDECTTLDEGEPCSFIAPCVREVWDYYMGRCGYFKGYCEDGRLVERDETYSCMVAPECGSLADSLSIELTTPTGSTDHVQSVEARYVGAFCDPEIRLSLHMDPTDALPARLDVHAPLPFELFDREESFEGVLVLDASYQWEGELDRIDGELTLVRADVTSEGRVVGELSVDDPSLQLTAGFDLQWCTWDTCP